MEVVIVLRASFSTFQAYGKKGIIHISKIFLYEHQVCFIILTLQKILHNILYFSLYISVLSFSLRFFGSYQESKKYTCLSSVLK